MIMILMIFDVYHDTGIFHKTFLNIAKCWFLVLYTSSLSFSPLCLRSGPPLRVEDVILWWTLSSPVARQVVSFGQGSGREGGPLAFPVSVLASLRFFQVWDTSKKLCDLSIRLSLCTLGRQDLPFFAEDSSNKSSKSGSLFHLSIPCDVATSWRAFWNSISLYLPSSCVDCVPWWFCMLCQLVSLVSSNGWYCFVNFTGVFCAYSRSLLWLAFSGERDLSSLSHAIGVLVSLAFSK